MRKKIEELNTRWDDFIYKCSLNTELDERDVAAYSSLMTDTFRILREEWNSETVNRDIALLFATIGSFVPAKDVDYNILGSEEYERITTFNTVFITNLFRKETFVYDKRGRLMLDTYNDRKISINPETFEMPPINVIYGL